jgi:hypothetical protein
MFRSFALLLLCPVMAFARCGTHRLQYYDLLIGQNRYSEALHLVLTDLNATPSEERAFKIIPVSDDEAEPLSMSPAVLQAGKSTACQQAAGVLTRVRDRRKDRAQLKAYHEDWIASRSGWAGCDIAGKNLDQPAEATAVATECLADSSLGTHQAALEIHALMARAAAGDVPRLSDEDTEALQQQLGIFYDGRSVFNDKTTDSYYLPDIKRADRQLFCKAVAYARLTLHLKGDEMSLWQAFCQTTVQGPMSKVPR